MKLLVHLHIFYYNQTGYFVSKLANISGCDWDLYVTEYNHDAGIENQFQTLGANVHYVSVENRGYDVWPFIKVIKSVNLDDYDLVMKLHTKNRRDRSCKINGIKLNGFQWRNELVDSLLSSKAHFRRLLGYFETDPKLGLVCSRWLYKKTSNSLAEDLSKLQDEIGRLGLENMGEYFCAGTMFMARADMYGFLLSDKVSAEMFSTRQHTTSQGSMAHVYERILSMIPGACSYKVRTVSTSRYRSLHLVFIKKVQPVLTWLLSITRIGEDRIKYLTVFGKRIRLSRRR